MAYETIQTHQEGRVGVVTLNRPKALNALSPLLIDELVSALQQFDSDASIGAMVVSGSDKAFAAGADISQMATASVQSMRKNDLIGPWDAIAHIKKPIVAAVNGYALGGGFEVALMCDLIIAGESAQFGLPEIGLGVIPGAGGTQRLLRIVGKARTMELVLTGKRINAQQALGWGIVNTVVSAEKTMSTALELAQSIAAQPGVAAQTAKAVILQGFEAGLTASVAHERDQFYGLFDTHDQKEGMAAFLEKRPASFTHQ